MSIIRRMEEGDNLYEVIFDDGRKESGLYLKKAAALVEEQLAKNRKDVPGTKGSPESDNSCCGLAYRSSLGGKQSNS